jgi:hypothetical protein
MMHKYQSGGRKCPDKYVSFAGSTATLAMGKEPKKDNPDKIVISLGAAHYARSVLA